jgi:hypothetical protein
MKKITQHFLVLLLASYSFFSQAETEETSSVAETECERISDKLASVNLSECLLNQLQSTKGYSAEGAPILYKEYHPVANRQPLGRVLLIGGIHGDEYSSVSIVFKWMNTLNEFHSGLFHWRILPLLNPDGLLRKDSQRMNSNDVDLNRNFPMLDWKNATNNYWVNVTKRNPRRFPGIAPLSESETQLLVAEINQFKPDVIVAVHAPHGIIDYDGPKNGPYKLGRLYLNLLGTYPGSLGNYAGVQMKIPVVTIELPYAGIMPKPAEVAHIWRDLVNWLSKNIVAQQDESPAS